MDNLEEKLAKLRGEFQTEQDQVRISEWEKAVRRHILTSNLRHNDAFKLVIAKYEAERARLRKSLSEDASLFKTTDGLIVGRVIHERIGFINEFFRIFDVAESQAKGILKQIDTALSNDN